MSRKKFNDKLNLQNFIYNLEKDEIEFDEIYKLFTDKYSEIEKSSLGNYLKELYCYKLTDTKWKIIKNETFFQLDNSSKKRVYQTNSFSPNKQPQQQPQPQQSPQQPQQQQSPQQLQQQPQQQQQQPQQQQNNQKSYPNDQFEVITMDWEKIPENLDISKPIHIKNVPYEDFDFMKFRKIYGNSKIETRNQEGIILEHSIEEVLSNNELYGIDIPLQQLIPNLQKEIEDLLLQKLKKLFSNNLFNFLLPGLLFTFVGYLGNTSTGTKFHVDKDGTVAYNLIIYSEPNAFKKWIFLENDNCLEKEEKESLYSGDLKIDPVRLNKLNSITLVQKLNELVLVPAGMPHSVVNTGLSFAVASNLLLPQYLEVTRKLNKIYRDMKLRDNYQWRYVILCYYISLNNSSTLRKEEEKFHIELVELLKELKEIPYIEEGILIDYKKKRYWKMFKMQKFFL